MSAIDPRVSIVLDVIQVENIEDVSQSDFDRLEDNFLAQANEVVLDDVQLEHLKASGFAELATRLGELKNASLAYDWSRENL